MKIAIFGSGGVGGYFGGRLAAVRRRRRVHRARRAPRSAPHPADCASSVRRAISTCRTFTRPERPRTIGVVDVVFFAVKMYDADAAAATLSPLVGPDTVVIPFQNGVESVEILSRHLPPANVAGGVAYITAVITEPGVIRHTVMDQVIFGEINGGRSARLERLLEACQRAHFQARAERETSR